MIAFPEESSACSAQSLGRGERVPASASYAHHIIQVFQNRCSQLTACPRAATLDYRKFDGFEQSKLIFSRSLRPQVQGAQLTELCSLQSLLGSCFWWLLENLGLPSSPLHCVFLSISSRDTGSQCRMNTSPGQPSCRHCHSYEDPGSN